MKDFRIERTVTAVQYTYLRAETAAEAEREAVDNGHQLQWHTSSENDPTVADVREVT